MVPSRDEKEVDVHLAILDRLDEDYRGPRWRPMGRRTPSRPRPKPRRFRRVLRVRLRAARRFRRSITTAMDGARSAMGNGVRRVGDGLQTAIAGAATRARARTTTRLDHARSASVDALSGLTAAARRFGRSTTRRVADRSRVTARAAMDVAASTRVQAAARLDTARSASAGALTALGGAAGQLSGGLRAARTRIATARATFGPGMRRSLAYSAPLVLLLVLAVLGWRASLFATAARARGPVTAPLRVEAETPAAAALRDASTSEETKVAIVEQLASDRRDETTDLLVAATDSPSVLVAMAAIRALRGRPCARVAAPLARRMAGGRWQGRAWAAKVLGENGCASAAPEMRSLLARERDPRVRQQLSAALATLDVPSAG